MEPNSSNPWIFLDGYFWNYPSSFFLDILNSNEMSAPSATMPSLNAIPVFIVSEMF